MKVIIVEGSSPAEIEAKVKVLGLDGPDVLIVGKVLTRGSSDQPVLVEGQGEGKPS